MHKDGNAWRLVSSILRSMSVVYVLIIGALCACVLRNCVSGCRVGDDMNVILFNSKWYVTSYWSCVLLIGVFVGAFVPRIPLLVSLFCWVTTVTMVVTEKGVVFVHQFSDISFDHLLAIYVSSFVSVLVWWWRSRRNGIQRSAYWQCAICVLLAVSSVGFWCIQHQERLLRYQWRRVVFSHTSVSVSLPCNENSEMLRVNHLLPGLLGYVGCAPLGVDSRGMPDVGRGNEYFVSIWSAPDGSVDDLKRLAMTCWGWNGDYSRHMISQSVNISDGVLVYETEGVLYSTSLVHPYYRERIYVAKGMLYKMFVYDYMGARDRHNEDLFLNSISAISHVE